MTQKVSTLPTGVPKVRLSLRTHILPPLAGVAAMLFTYVLLNLPSFEAQARYYIAQLEAPKASTNSAPAAVVDSRLSDIIIPSIGVKAPVIYESSVNETNIAYDLRSGVVHYGTTALPGEKGNVAIFGHSSGLTWAPGNYKFVFTLLNKLQPGQQISLDYKGVRYVYVVTDSEIVAPSDMRVLDSNGASQLSLITCTPVGTSRNRLIIHAKQIHPDPAGNKPFKPAEKSAAGVLPT